MAPAGLDGGRPAFRQRRSVAPVAAGGDGRGAVGGVRERAAETAEDAKERVESLGLVQRLVAAHKELVASGVDVPKVSRAHVVQDATWLVFLVEAMRSGVSALLVLRVALKQGMKRLSVLSLDDGMCRWVSPRRHSVVLVGSGVCSPCAAGSRLRQLLQASNRLCILPLKAPCDSGTAAADGAGHQLDLRPLHPNLAQQWLSAGASPALS
jgi:hypothetical protein